MCIYRTLIHIPLIEMSQLPPSTELAMVVAANGTCPPNDTTTKEYNEFIYF